MELNREELIRQREELDRQLEEMDIDKVKFTVDAGIIDRLGRELVGRQETAVSELVKNAYDADATEVTLRFINTDNSGGILVVEDNGHGMDRYAIRNGFMRLSSTDKIHHPISPKFKRKRAGRKGIGRFATQRLSRKLIITTQTAESKVAFQVVIDWDKYEIDRDINLIVNEISEIPRETGKVSGTCLAIENLREKWTIAEIQRVFRYVSDLLQPSYLSDRLIKSDIKYALQNDTYFSVKCEKVTDGLVETVIDIDKSFFDKALAVFEGFIDKNGEGFCSIQSKSLNLKEIENIISIIPDPKRYNSNIFKSVNEVHFKAYYFIYNRVDYYQGDGIGISSIELKRVNDFSKDSSGIKLYRNGYRVLPYGDIGDDWLDIDERYTAHSGKDIVPFGNKNVFGFVEIVDETGNIFEETSSREGLIKNDAFEDLVDFLRSSFQACRRRLESSVQFKEKRKERQSRIENTKEQKEKIQQLKLFIESSPELGKEPREIDQEDEGIKFNKEQLKEALENLEQTIDNQIDEIAMLRVLAGLGLSIGQFVHEVKQFNPGVQSALNVLRSKNLDDGIKNTINNLASNFSLFKTYAAYFDKSIRRNISRKTEPIGVRKVIRDFLEIIKSNAEKSHIKIETSFTGYDLYTCPMHPSEWSSILFNFYSNSKKAIDRAGIMGNILIEGKEENGKIVVEFHDNGVGIPIEDRDRIFRAFFTTSNPTGREASQDEEMLGTGLGLKIVSDIIESYEGEIFVTASPEGFKTTMRIELPKASQEWIDKNA